MLLDNLPAQINPYLAKDADLIKIVLLQAGVYAAGDLLKAFPAATIYAIENDWRAAGLKPMNQVELISYDKWVAMSGEFQPVVTVQT
jgi:sulfur relay protein TusB/DsrH